MTELDPGLALILSKVAADLDAKGYGAAGVVRQAARALAAAPMAHATADGCEGCGAPIDQPTTGGRRKWCTERCRRRNRP